MAPSMGGPDILDAWLLFLPNCLGGGRGRPLPLASGRPWPWRLSWGGGSPGRCPERGLRVGWAGCYASGAEETLPSFCPQWGLLGDGQAPVKELDSWGPGTVPASPKGPCLGGRLHPATPLDLHNAKADTCAVHHVLSLPFSQSWGPSPRSQVVRPQLQGHGHHGPGAIMCPTYASEPGAR